MRSLLRGLGGVVAALAMVCSLEGSAADGPTLGWSHSSEAGVALSGGNTESTTLTLKQDTGHRWEKDFLNFKAKYFLTKAASTPGATQTKTGENWLFGLRYERDLSDRFAIYLGNSWQGDKFAGFDRRMNIDAGGKYWLIPGDKKKDYLFTEFGYRYTSERAIAGSNPRNITSHFLRSYTEAAKPLTESVQAKLWIEILPDLADTDNFLFNFEPSLAVALSNNLALKLAFLGRYDGQPTQAGLKKFDYLYTTSLVATF